MDTLDLQIIKKLLLNSRLTYRNLAEQLDISVSAMHKRIQNIVDDGTINAFIARPTMIALKGLWIIATGVSDAKSMDNVSKELGDSEYIYFVGVAGGKFLYITAYLRNVSEMQSFSTFVVNAAHIKEPTIGIINVPYQTTPGGLSSLDFKILKVLNRNSRLPVSEIADLVGISPKTAKKHLDYMIQNNLAWFTIEWTPRSTNNFMTNFHITLAEGMKLGPVMQNLYKKYDSNLAYCLSFSNLPRKFTMHTWAENSLESQKVQESLQTEGFEDIMPRIMLYGSYYDCWVDQMLRLK